MTDADRALVSGMRRRMRTVDQGTVPHVLSEAGASVPAGLDEDESAAVPKQYGPT